MNSFLAQRNQVVADANGRTAGTFLRSSRELPIATAAAEAIISLPGTKESVRTKGASWVKRGWD